MNLLGGCSKLHIPQIQLSQDVHWLSKYIRICTVLCLFFDRLTEIKGHSISVTFF